MRFQGFQRPNDGVKLSSLSCKATENIYFTSFLVKVQSSSQVSNLKIHIRVTAFVT